VTNPMKGAEEDSAGTKEGAQSIRISTTRTAPYQSGMMRGHVRDVGLPSESTSASRAVGAGSGSSISSGSLGSLWFNVNSFFLYLISGGHAGLWPRDTWPIDPIA
jgi:hypothetical protein